MTSLPSVFFDHATIDAWIAEDAPLLDLTTHLLAIGGQSVRMTFTVRGDTVAACTEEAARVGAAAEGDDVQLLGDERLLRRALRNLLENAQRYGGGEIEASVARQGAQVELRVCDRGPGVPETHRERIFEAFFRLPGHAEREGGVGLGLSLVRQIAERHGGRVRCEPREGGGSCFVMNLPLA